MQNCKRFFTKQWSFIMAGIVFGIAQIIYIVGLWTPSFGKPISEWKVDPITVTTDLGKTFRAMEVWINHLFGFTSELYGTYGATSTGELISNGGAFVPGVGPVIIGMIIGGFLVTLAEKQNRLWVKYPAKLLFVSFLGGIIFSYGTRIAGGCTLNHLLGGIPMMNIHSTVAVIFMSFGGLLAFWIMTKLGLAKYFKHQENFDYVKSQTKNNDGITYDPKYKSWKNIYTWIGLTFLIIFMGVAIYGMIYSPDYLEHLKDDKIKHFGKSIAHKGTLYVLITMLAGIIGGFAMGKSGFGTECALISAEASSIIRKDEKKWQKLGLPNITRTLFKGLLPLQGVAIMWVILTAFIIITVYTLGMGHGFSGDIKYELTMGVPLGGFLLGFGAVLLIGCEIRSYMRLGMLYLNTLIGFIGFAIGYLPFTIYFKAHKSFLENTAMSKLFGIEPVYTWPELFAGNNEIGQLIVALIWYIMIVLIFIWAVKKGTKYLKIKNSADLTNLNTEEIHEKYGK